MLIRRHVFEEAGLLDESYFFGYEDIEFCLRARNAGFLTAVWNGARRHTTKVAARSSGTPRERFILPRGTTCSRQ